MLLSQQGLDTSQLMGAITTHMLVIMCILLVSAVSNSLTEENVQNPESIPQQTDSKEAQPKNQAVDSQVQSKPDGEEEEENKCWMEEGYDTQGPCVPCDEFTKARSPGCCGETGFRQEVICKISQRKAFKSCPRSRWSIERGFWTFEGVMFALGLCSGIVALVRRRKLDWKALERVRKQIANSV